MGKRTNRNDGQSGLDKHKVVMDVQEKYLSTGRTGRGAGLLVGRRAMALRVIHLDGQVGELLVKTNNRRTGNGNKRQEGQVTVLCVRFLISWRVPDLAIGKDSDISNEGATIGGGEQTK